MLSDSRGLGLVYFLDVLTSVKSIGCGFDWFVLGFSLSSLHSRSMLIAGLKVICGFPLLMCGEGRGGNSLSVPRIFSTLLSLVDSSSIVSCWSLMISLSSLRWFWRFGVSLWGDVLPGYCSGWAAVDFWICWSGWLCWSGWSNSGVCCAKIGGELRELWLSWIGTSSVCSLYCIGRNKCSKQYFLTAPMSCVSWDNIWCWGWSCMDGNYGKSSCTSVNEGWFFIGCWHIICWKQFLMSLVIELI